MSPKMADQFWPRRAAWAAVNAGCKGILSDSSPVSDRWSSVSMAPLDRWTASRRGPAAGSVAARWSATAGSTAARRRRLAARTRSASMAAAISAPPLTSCGRFLLPPIHCAARISNRMGVSTTRPVWRMTLTWAGSVSCQISENRRTTASMGRCPRASCTLLCWTICRLFKYTCKCSLEAWAFLRNRRPCRITSLKMDRCSSPFTWRGSNLAKAAISAG